MCRPVRSSFRCRACSARRRRRCRKRSAGQAGRPGPPSQVPGGPGRRSGQPQVGGPPKPGAPGDPDSRPDSRRSAARRSPVPGPVAPAPGQPQVGGPPKPGPGTTRTPPGQPQVGGPPKPADPGADGLHRLPGRPPAAGQRRGRMRAAFADAAGQSAAAPTRGGKATSSPTSNSRRPVRARPRGWWPRTTADEKAIFITEAWYLPGPDKPWVKVLDEAGPAEIFVPYQNNAHRFSDLIVLQLQLEPLTDPIRGRCGQLIDRPNARAQRIVREITEKGLLWMAPHGRSRPPSAISAATTSIAATS